MRESEAVIVSQVHGPLGSGPQVKNPLPTSRGFEQGCGMLGSAYLKLTVASACRMAHLVGWKLGGQWGACRITSETGTWVTGGKLRMGLGGKANSSCTWFRYGEYGRWGHPRGMSEEDEWIGG